MLLDILTYVLLTTALAICIVLGLWVYRHGLNYNPFHRNDDT